MTHIPIPHAAITQANAVLYQSTSTPPSYTVYKNKVSVFTECVERSREISEFNTTIPPLLNFYGIPGLAERYGVLRTKKNNFFPADTTPLASLKQVDVTFNLMESIEGRPHSVEYQIQYTDISKISDIITECNITSKLKAQHGSGCNIEKSWSLRDYTHLFVPSDLAAARRN